MQFDVTVERNEYREHVFRVEAENIHEAHQAGLDASCDYDFHDSPIQFAKDDVTAIAPVIPETTDASSDCNG